MRSPLISRAKKWVGASALAILVGIGGGSAFVAASSQQVTAQVQPAAQITLPTPAEPTGFADLVQTVKPAVVSIIVEAQEKNAAFQGNGGQFQFQFPDLPDNDPLQNFFDQFRDQFGQRGPNGQGQGDDNNGPGRRFMAAGSGFIISPDGYIVTNNHVVKDATKVTVVFDNGDEQTAKVIGTDERTDIALIKIDGNNLPYVKFSETAPRVGDWVVAVGNPFGLGGTVTAGIVSASGRDIGGSSYGDFIQIDAAVNTGNSGGPAFNLSGEVVGMNTAIFSPNGGNVGIAFAIPSDTIKDIVGQLKSSGTVTRGFLGVGIQDVTHDLADSLGLKSAHGALVTTPTEDGPAAKAGINSGDVITAVNDQPVTNALALSRIIASTDPNTAVDLTLWRNGKEDHVKVTLGTLDQSEQVASNDNSAPAEPAQPAPSSVGLTLVPNSNGDGLLVQDIDPNSVAADKGFQVGDAILSVDNKDVKTAQEFEKAIDGVKTSGRGTALIKAERDGNVRFLGLPLNSSQNG